MKILVWALSLSLVGSCATKRYTEKLEDIRNSIAFENEALVVEYANTITSEELKSIVYDIASEEYQGRKTGELGHNKLLMLVSKAHWVVITTISMCQNHLFQVVITAHKML